MTLSIDPAAAITTTPSSPMTPFPLHSHKTHLFYTQPTHYSIIKSTLCTVGHTSSHYIFNAVSRVHVCLGLRASHYWSVFPPLPSHLTHTGLILMHPPISPAGASTLSNSGSRAHIGLTTLNVQYYKYVCVILLYYTHNTTSVSTFGPITPNLTTNH